MNRPKSMQVYKDMDLKLGIKSSLPKAKSTLALLILLWLSNDKSADLRYSVQDATKIRMSEECKDNLKEFIQNIDAGLDFDTVLEKVESKEAKYQWELSEYLNRDICQPEGFDAYGYPSELFKLDMERLGIAAKRKPAKVIDFSQYIESNRGTND